MDVVAAEGGRWMRTGTGGWGRGLGQADLSGAAGGWPRSTAGLVADAESGESRSRLAGRLSEDGSGAGGTGEGPSRRLGQEAGASS